MMEGLQRLFGSKDPAIRWLRNSGLRKINSLTPLKNWLAKQAMGL
jgi:2-polyprenylphenol 6-hydroxylase